MTKKNKSRGKKNKSRGSILSMVSRKDTPGKMVIYSTSDEQARVLVSAIQAIQAIQAVKAANAIKTAKAKNGASLNPTQSSEPSGNGNSLPSTDCDAFNISIKPDGFTLRSPDKNGINRAVGPHGTPYEEVLFVAYGNTTKITAYKEVTPIKSNEDEMEWGRYIAFNASSPGKKAKTEQEYPGLFNKPQEFEFTVTPESIKKREKECTQQDAVGNSAENILNSLGATTKKRQGYGSHYHLGHRQAHCHGGREIIENLDICTEGANYTLLAYIESPIYKQIASEQAESAVVRGEVYFHSATGIAESISYNVTFFPSGTQCTKQINLFDYRKPTLFENRMAMALLSNSFFNQSNSSENLENLENVVDGVADENTTEAANPLPVNRQLF